MKDLEARNLDLDVFNLRFKHYQELFITNVNNYQINDYIGSTAFKLLPPRIRVDKLGDCCAFPSSLLRTHGGKGALDKF